MKILVLGPTGGTWREVVAQALDAGHQVTVLVRDPKRLGVAADRVRVISGDITADPEVLRQAVAGQDAVISALGVGDTWRDVPLAQLADATNVRKGVIISG